VVAAAAAVETELSCCCLAGAMVYEVVRLLDWTAARAEEVE